MVKKETYSISELAKEFDVTTRSIRFYEDQELLRPTRRGQTRIFSSKDRVRLKLILRGKTDGLFPVRKPRNFSTSGTKLSAVMKSNCCLCWTP